MPSAELGRTRLDIQLRALDALILGRNRSLLVSNPSAQLAYTTLHAFVLLLRLIHRQVVAVVNHFIWLAVNNMIPFFTGYQQLQCLQVDLSALEDDNRSDGCHQGPASRPRRLLTITKARLPRGPSSYECCNFFWWLEELSFDLPEVRRSSSTADL